MTKRKLKLKPRLKYSDKIANAICERLMAGESLRSITADKTMPSETTAYAWLARYPEFAEKYTRARARQADYWAEEILDIADDASNDWMRREGKHKGGHDENPGWVANGENLGRSRLRVEARKWLMSKLAPKKYGDKVELAGDPEAPVKQEVTTRLYDNLPPIDPPKEKES
jgi:hypothetical protein